MHGATKKKNSSVNFYVQNNKHTHTQNYKNFLNKVARSWISEVQNLNYSSFDEVQWPEKQTTPKWLKLDIPCILSRDFTEHKLDNTAAGKEGKKYPARPCEVHAAHKRSETRYICKSCVPLHEGSWFVK